MKPKAKKFRLRRNDSLTAGHAPTDAPQAQPVDPSPEPTVEDGFGAQDFKPKPRRLDRPAAQDA